MYFDIKLIVNSKILNNVAIPAIPMLHAPYQFSEMGVILKQIAMPKGIIIPQIPCQGDYDSLSLLWNTSCNINGAKTRVETNNRFHPRSFYYNLGPLPNSGTLLQFLQLQACLMTVKILICQTSILNSLNIYNSITSKSLGTYKLPS